MSSQAPGEPSDRRTSGRKRNAKTYADTGLPPFKTERITATTIECKELTVAGEPMSVQSLPQFRSLVKTVPFTNDGTAMGNQTWTISQVADATANLAVTTIQFSKGSIQSNFVYDFGNTGWQVNTGIGIGELPSQFRPLEDVVFQYKYRYGADSVEFCDAIIYQNGEIAYDSFNPTTTGAPTTISFPVAWAATFVSPYVAL